MTAQQTYLFFFWCESKFLAIDRIVGVFGVAGIWFLHHIVFGRRVRTHGWVRGIEVDK